MNKKRQVDKELERIYGMNAKLDEIKSKIVFKKEKDYFTFKKVRFAFISTAIILMVGAISGISCYFIGSNNDNTHLSTSITEDEIIKEGLEYVDSKCDSRVSLPINTFYIDDDFSLYIYKGFKESTPNIDYLFYQIVEYDSEDRQILLSFSSESEQEYNISINEDNYLGEINGDFFTISSYLNIEVYNFEELLLDIRVII